MHICWCFGVKSSRWYPKQVCATTFSRTATNAWCMYDAGSVVQHCIFSHLPHSPSPHLPHPVACPASSSSQSAGVPTQSPAHTFHISFTPMHTRLHVRLLPLSHRMSTPPPHTFPHYLPPPSTPLHTHLHVPLLPLPQDQQLPQFKRLQQVLPNRAHLVQTFGAVLPPPPCCGAVRLLPRPTDDSSNGGREEVYEHGNAAGHSFYFVLILSRHSALFSLRLRVVERFTYL